MSETLNRNMIFVRLSVYTIEAEVILMYGLVNRAVQELITENYGAETWAAIRKDAGVADEVFVSSMPYPDKVTYDLVSATSRILKKEPGDVLRTFGEYWVLNVAPNAYGSLIDAYGATLRDFLLNLPNLHARIQLMFPKLKPPEFSCSDLAANSIVLHYRSERPGLVPFVIGLLQGLGKRFNTPIKILHLSEHATGSTEELFRISW